MDLGLSGRTALVLASTGGIGLGIARALHAEGARVVITGRRADKVAELTQELPGSVGITVDLTDLDQVRALVPQVGEVDVLVLNSGGPPPAPAAELTDEAVVAAFEQLFRGHREIVAAALPGMRERGWGRIVGVGSSGVVEPLPELAASNIGRAALAAYLKSLAVTVAHDGVTCNMVLPGRIDTDRVRSMDTHRAQAAGRSLEDQIASARQSIPARRYGTVEEFGAVATFLCSQQASYVTGAQLRVDGGLTRSY